MKLESQEYRFGESEQSNSHLTENDANFSNTDYSNENTAFNLAPDSRFVLSQEGNPLGAGSSDCLVGVPPHVSDDKQEEIGNYWT
ncbi:hypothetical protein AVEN_86774-1, partial [Araneus ventricosus]